MSMENYDLSDFFPQKLRLLMKQRGKTTQEDLATAVGVKQSAVNKWVNGNALPNADSLLRIAQFFEVSADSLLGWQTTKERIATQTAAASVIAELGDTEEAKQILFNKFVIEFEKNRQALVAAAEAIEESKRSSENIQATLKNLFESAKGNPLTEAELAASLARGEVPSKIRDYVEMEVSRVRAELHDSTAERPTDEKVSLPLGTARRPSQRPASPKRDPKRSDS